MACMKIDESSSTDQDNTYLTCIYRIDGSPQDVVRVRVRHNFYETQSYAVAEVLNADRKWTDLVSEPTGTWHATTGHCGIPLVVMSSVATDLARRARTVLTGIHD